MKKLIISLLLLTVLAGCERKIDSKDPVRPYPDDIAAPTNLAVVLDDASVTLSWDIDDPASIAQYVVYISENDPGDFVRFDSTANMSITFDDLEIGRIYYFQVSAVYSDGLESLASSYSSAVVAHVSMIINGGNDFTNNRNVTVQFTAPSSAAYVIVSEDPAFSDAVYQVFNSSKSFLIDSDNDGVKTIYSTIQFTDGGESGELLSDDITLDTKVWIDSVFFRPTETVFAPEDTILFGLNSGETDGNASVSFQGVSGVVLLDDGLAPDNIAGDGIYYGWYIVPVSMDIYHGTVTGSFTDRAGNRAQSVTSYELLNVNTPSLPVTLTGYLTPAGDSIVFNWTKTEASDFVSYRIYYDENSSNVNTDDEILIDLYSSATTSYKAEALLGTTYYRVFQVDKHGDEVGSNTVEIIRGQ